MLKTLSPGFQVLIFLFVVYFMAGMGNIIYTFSLSFSIDRNLLEHANWLDPRVILSRNLFFQVFSFLLAFMVMLRFTETHFRSVLYLDRIRMMPILITFGVFILGMVGMELFAWLNAPLHHYLPAEALQHEASLDTLNNELIFQTDTVQFIFSLIVMAILPAICEELVFRGYLIKKMLESGIGMHGAVLLSAAIFSLTHFQPLKFLPIFFLGVCLGYVYLYFKNIKYAMLLHFLVNGSQILMGYLSAVGVLNLDF